ncbi:hypothetical protein [Nocardia sp. NBC_00511]|uniref:hypothetical protein n=1 Tax=Nocardia sp. NBC_00511 TaxID=2903591 RepID=UPI0030E02D2E
MTAKSPQEKKALSYARDRRNAHGENDKSSRKAIRLNKRRPNRADRRQDRQTVAAVRGVVAPEVSEGAENRLGTTTSNWFKRGWRKRPDIPLGEFVIRQLRKRDERG